MSTRRAFFLALAGVGLGARAADTAPPLLRDVRQRLGNDPLLRGTFEQRKTVKGFRHPIVSTGDFVVARERGVVWRTLTPFASTLVVTRDSVIARQADGRIARRLSAGEEPAVRVVSETLFGVMAADLSVLAQRFEISGDVGRDSWHLALQPRDAALARWITRMELEGDRHLTAVRMQEASGDGTAIRLAHHSVGTTLSADEEAQFE